MKEAPEHLTDESKVIWGEILEEYVIEDSAGLKILQTALEAYDRAQKARATIDEQGMIFYDKFNQKKPHPLLSTERDSRAAFLAGLKQLNLDLEPLRKTLGRPPGR
jgi:phage terminase small subunit